MNTKKYTSIYANEFFLCIKSCAGYRRYGSDPGIPAMYMEMPPNENELGEAIINSLSLYRRLNESEIAEFFSVNRISDAYEAWVFEVLEKYNISSRKIMFKNMKHCMVELDDSLITIIPTKHAKLEAWGGGGVAKSQYVSVQLNSSLDDIGNSVTLALSRCR